MPLLLSARTSGVRNVPDTRSARRGPPRLAFDFAPGVGTWMRRATAALILTAVLATGPGVAQAAKPTPAATMPAAPLPVESGFPSLDGASGWLNSKPLTPAALRGKVVLVDFWTYSCSNCLHALPYVEAWHRKYQDHGLVVIGVHSPEFAFEKVPSNVAAAVRRLGVQFPVALDADYAIWRGFDNRYWPAEYFIDARGRIRHHHFGEGAYAEGEDVIRALLREAGHANLPGGYVQPDEIRRRSGQARVRFHP